MKILGLLLLAALVRSGKHDLNVFNFSRVLAGISHFLHYKINYIVSHTRAATSLSSKNVLCYFNFHYFRSLLF